MTKFEKLYNDIDEILDKRRIFPKGYELIGGGHIKSKGYDKTQDGGVRNEYGNGWNDATMELGQLIAEVLDKYYEKKK